MEKFSQFRDRGSGIAPFLPIPTQHSGLQLPMNVFLFCFRLPLFVFVCLSYFLVLQWLPIGSLGKKASLWCILGVPSVWWIDLQVDGVKKGSLSKQQSSRLPHPGSVIASSFTCPIDAIYLAAIFDPVFTASYPNVRQVEHISLFQAILRAFAPPQLTPRPGARLVDVSTLLQKYPNCPLVMFPECTTTNGRGILPPSQSLLGVPPKTKIFPVSLRYTPTDAVTPLPGTYFSFLWKLLSKPTHCIRVRIAECVVSGGCGGAGNAGLNPGKLSADTVTSLSSRRLPFSGNQGQGQGQGQFGAVLSGEEQVSLPERTLLDQVGESLARLGRVKRVGLGVKEKRDFIALWIRTRRVW